MKKNRYTSLRRRIIVITLAVSIAPLLLLGGIIYNQFLKVSEQRIKDQIVHLARTQRNSLEVFLSERTTILSLMVDAYNFRTLSQQGNLAHLFDMINRRSEALGLVDLGVINSQGYQVAYVGPYNLKGLNYYQQSWFSQVISRGKFVSDVFMGFRQVPHFIIAVRGQDGEQSWILRATIDSDIFNQLVRSGQAGRNGDAYILNKQGIYQTQPRFEGQILGGSDINFQDYSPGTTTVLQRGLGNGQILYISGVWLKNYEWLLIISQQTSDQAGGLLETRNTEILIISLGCAGIILATMLTAHMVVRQLELSDREMDRLNSQLIQQDKLAALGKMAAGIAHEINNPLAVIGEKAGWMRDLLQEEQLKESIHLDEFNKSLNKIDEHVDRARKITHHMLGFARRMEPHLDDVEINKVLDQTLELLQNHARINNIKIEKAYADHLPVIASDQSQLQQVMLNLINNAVDAIGSDGLIRIATGLQNSHLVIQVSDNGPGIPKEIQRRIFDPFFSTKAPGKGTGLGLSISYHIIDKMGGSLSCESTEAVGTTFTVKLPVVVPERK